MTGEQMRREAFTFADETAMTNAEFGAYMEQQHQAEMAEADAREAAALMADYEGE